MLADANILQPLIDVANAVLKFFHDNVGLSWGMSIVAITVCTRALLIPLTYKQIKGMRAMQALQPQIKELQEKYKNDKQRMQQEMMRFYKENKVNPFASLHPADRAAAGLHHALLHAAPRAAEGHLLRSLGSLRLRNRGPRLVPLRQRPDREGARRRTDRAAGPLRRHPAGLGLLHVGHRGQIAADDDVHPAADLRPLRDQLPGRADRLLDHHQPLDDRPGDHGQQTDPGADSGDAGGETGGETAA